MQTLVSSEVELIKRASAILSASPYWAIRNVEVDVDEPGRLCLRGIVSTFYLKQLAQEVVRGFAVSEGLRVNNRIEVSIADLGRFVDGICP